MSTELQAVSSAVAEFDRVAAGLAETPHEEWVSLSVTDQTEAA